jgi:hypothetical protein
MAALAADLNIEVIGPAIIAPFSANAADTYYQGSVVFIDASGGVQLATYVAGDRCIGISPIQQVIGAAGDLVQVLIFGVVWFPAIAGIAATDEGSTLVFDANGTVSDNINDADADGITVAANDTRVGRVLRYTAARTLVFIGGGLTGSLSVGTAGTWD